MKYNYFDKPSGAEFVVGFSNETGAELSVSELNEMFTKIGDVLDEFGYSISSWGTYASAVRFYGKHAFSRLVDEIIKDENDETS